MQTIDLQGSPLSIQQARLWSWQKNTPAYQTLCAFQLRGALQKNTLRIAIEQIVAQHEILHTLFYTLPGMDIPVQVIASRDLWSWSEVNLESLEASHQLRKIDDLLTAFQEDSYNLQDGPLLRICLVSLAAERHFLTVCLPALCADSHSLKFFIGELAKAYTQEIGRSREHIFTDEVLQYADVSAWQEDLLQGDETAPEREYWRTVDLSHMTSLHTFFAQGKCNTGQQDNQAFAPDLLDMSLPSSLEQQIEDLAQRENASISSLLLACWQVLLWRLSGEATFVIGVACDGRTDEELTNALGPYVRFVPICANFEKDGPFDLTLASVNISLQEAIEQCMYFSWDEMSAPMAMDNNVMAPFFPVSFEYETWPATIKAGPLSFSLYKYRSCSEPFMLKLSVVLVEKRLQIALHYDPCWIDVARVRQLATIFRTLLAGVVAHSSSLSSTFPLLEVHEQAALLQMSRAASQPLPHRGLHQLFEEQAQRYPHQLAVLSQQEQLTYQQLNARANQLAHVLRAQGVGPHQVVGLCLARGAHLLVGLLAILKAGGAYLPLDPTTPAPRLLSLLQQSHALLLVTQHSLATSLHAWGGTTLLLDALEPQLSLAPTLDLALDEPVDGETLASVIYTSGSTGLPKGVMVRHHSLLNYTLALCAHLRAQPGWHYATVSTLAADLGNTAIFCALASGGCVQVLDYDLVTSTPALAHWTSQHPIDVLKMVPSHLAALLAGEPAQDILPRRALVLGGEVLPPSLLAHLHRLQASCQVYNHYGPTETTIGILLHSLPGLDTLPPLDSVPLGRPLANSEVYIVDRHMHLLPRGMTGELYLGGAGLAQGYLGQPAQTAERFVPHPWSQQPGARLYRTGDLAQLSEEGQITFVGRQDGQIKLRGYRIELAEIDAVLRAHPLVRDAVVLFEEQGPTAPRLIGYVVTRTASGLSVQTLAEHMRHQLPEYMVPSLFVLLDALPLSANGKVERRLLPRPEHLEQPTASVPGEPRSPLEELLLTQWKQLLAVPLLGIHDNFFAVGGHSLLATRLIAQVRAMLQVDLPVQAVFDAPTVALLAQCIERALRQNEGLPIPPLVAQARPQEIPLSYAQQRLWFLDQLAPESTAYLASRSLKVKGSVEVQSLERSLQELISRHESLRTTFEERADLPVQVIRPAGHAYLPVIDLQGLRQEQKEGEAQRLVSQEAQRPCDLTQGPLLRTYLLRLETQEHILLLTLHHIITDGWSNDVLVRELATLYQAFVSGLPSPLVPLQIQYADYALWQREWLQGEILEAQLTYWRKQLADMSPLELFTDYPRLPGQIYRGAVLSIELPEELSQHLIALSQQENVTVFMLLLTALQVLLMRYTGKTDINVGTPIANRTRAEIEGMIGFFVNTLVLRTNLSGDPTFLHTLQHVREVCLEAYTHQDVPFEKLVEMLQPERDLNHPSLFQVLFQFVHENVATQLIPGLSIESPGTDGASADYALSVQITQVQQRFSCMAFYDTDQFEARTIRLFLEHFQTLLQGIVLTPGKPLAQLPLLSEQDLHMQLVEWNNTTQRDDAQERYVHQLFEHQVLQTPDAVALVFEDQSLTYSQLNQRANQLAHHLHMVGVGPEVFVGVYMERSLEILIALLAIFKAGGVYVPLDPMYPAERLAWMLEDFQPVVVLTQARVASTFPSAHISLLCVDSDRQHWSHEPNTNLESQVTSENLAYVIYTSGSTGRPKGAMVVQRGLVNHLLVMIDDLQLCEQDAIAYTASPCFDISVWQSLTALLVGGCTVIYGADVVHQPTRLVERIQLDHISIFQTVPTFLRAILDNIAMWPQERERLFSLRWLIPTGEALPPNLCREWFEYYPAIPLLNAYGPAECSDDVTFYALRQAPAATAMYVPIGQPVSNMRMYVLNQHLMPLPIGIAGELYVGGTGVGRGYLNHPQWTAAAFLPDPFAREPGMRLYKTGDRGRYLADGTIEYLGRVDYQVKIRGFRIELGEIEAALGQHPAIQDSIVLVREDMPGEKQLVAYPVIRQGQILSSSNLRSYLQSRLPSYMIPSAFVPLDALPLTPNGKVDRRALPAPEEAQDVHLRVVEKAITPIEELLAGLWRETLGRRQVGVSENFFELGGHSLLATQLIARVRKVLQVELPLRAVFEEPTVTGLAQRIEQALRKGDAIQQLPLVAIERPKEMIPLSFAQQRLWFMSQLGPDITAYRVPCALRIEGEVDTQGLEWSLQELIHRHESLRTTFVERKDQPVQVIQPAGPYSLPVIDLHGLKREQREEEAQCLISQEAQCPCDLAKGPLLRTFLLRQERDAHVLLLTLHHIITDGWSNEVLVRELTTLYRAFVARQPSPLTPLSIQYADYALWQRAWLQNDVMETQLTYWKKQLAGVTFLELPTDAPRTAKSGNRGATYSFKLSTKLSEDLARLSQQEGVTLFMLLLAAFQVLLYRYSGQKDIVVGTDVANRNRIEIEGLIGFFVNQLALRSRLTNNQTFRELLDQVRNMTMDAYLHQDIPFEKLVEVIRPERNMHSSHFFRVKMILDSISTEASSSQAAFNLPNITIYPLSLTVDKTIELDLILKLFPTSEGFMGIFEYRTDLFKVSTIARMAQQFLILLESISTNPDEHLNTLEMITKQEKENQRIQRKEHEASLFKQIKDIRPKSVHRQKDR